MTDNGTIEPVKGVPGEFWIKPEREGKVGVYIRQWYTKQVARSDSVNFWASEMLLYCTAAGKQDGSVSKTALCISPSLYASGYSFQNRRWRVPIQQFDLSILRDGKEIYSKVFSEKNGGVIDAETQEFFFTLQNGDELVYKDITVLKCEKPIVLPIIRLNVIDAEKFILPAGDTVILDDTESGQTSIIVRHRRK